MFKRQFSIDLSCLSIVVFSLTIVGLFFLIGLNIKTLGEKWQSQLPIVVFFKDETSALENQKTLSKVVEIEDVHYISKKQALFHLRKQLGGKAIVLDKLDENPLLPSLEVHIKPIFQRPSFLKTFIKNIEHLPETRDIIYPKWLYILPNVYRIVKLFFLSIVLILFLSIIFIISNTIRLANYIDKDSINHSLYIRGLGYGALGALLALGILKAVCTFLSWKIQYLPLHLNILFFSAKESLVFLASGIILTLLSTFFALKNF